MIKVSVYQLKDFVFDLRLRDRVASVPLVAGLHHLITDHAIEMVLQVSPVRLKLLGWIAVISHIFFGLAWGLFFPQPYENVGVRLVLCLMIVGLIHTKIEPGEPLAAIQRYCVGVFWLQLPIFFTWLYWMNGANGVRQAGMVAMVLIYYQLTDWRLATLGLISGGAVATGIAYLQLGALPVVDGSIIISLVVCCGLSIALAISSANLRRERLQYSLAAVGMMANELKTPLTALSALGHTISRETANVDEVSRGKELGKTVKRIQWIARTIRHHIDLQMMNACLMQLPPPNELISASVLIRKTVALYPFHSQIELDSVDIVVHEDFTFYGAELQYIHVFNNLIKNALHTLRDSKTQFALGAIHFEIGKRGGVGRISIADQGMGIAAANLADIFEPFFSIKNVGSGLGLAFCKQVVQASGGDISVKSIELMGTQFSITLPIEEISSENRHKNKQSNIPSKLRL